MGYPLERDLKATAHDNRIQNNPITLGAIKDVHIFLVLVTGASAHAPRQSNSLYEQTTRRYIYKTIQTKHSHPPIRRYKKQPLGTRFLGLVAWNPSRTQYGSVLHYVYVYVYGQSTPSTSQPPRALFWRIKSHYVSVARSVIGIGVSALATVYALIQLTVSDWIWLTISNWIQLTVSKLILLTFSDLIQLTVSGSIWLSVFMIQFDSHLNFWSSIQVT